MTRPKIYPLHPEGIGEKAKGYSVRARMNHFKVFLRGFFWFFSFGLRYSTLLHLPPLRFHCVEGCRGRTQDSCDYGIGSQSSDALTARLDLIHNSPIDLIHSRLDLIHIWLDLNHTRLDLIHTRLWISSTTRLDLNHTRPDLIHNSGTSHPHSARSHPQLGHISSTFG